MQPSATEGFGCEVLEAMAHGRPVLCSAGAGSQDVIPEHWRFRPGDVEGLVESIRYMRNVGNCGEWGSADEGRTAITPGWIRERAASYTWDKIRARYVVLWKGMLGE